MPGAYAAAPPIDVFVGYADDLRASPFFPVPWASDANVLFIGSGPPFDAGAVRLDNRSGAPLTIDDVTVTLGGGAVSHSLWGTFKIPAGFSAILTQTTQFDFDTSDEFVFRSCGDPAPSGTEPFPRIFVT